MRTASQPAAPLKISDTPANEWAPAIAADKSGRIHVAFDSYQAGNYDVLLRTREADGTLSPAITVAGTPLFEARPSVAADPAGPGLGRLRRTDARLGQGRRQPARRQGLEPLPRQQGRGCGRRRPARPRTPQTRSNGLREPLEDHEQLSRGSSVDRTGRPWLAFRHRQEAIWGNNAVIVTGAVWTGQATSLSGPAWSVPQPLTRSDGLLDNRPALVQPREGPVLAFYSTDGRLRREAEMNPRAALRYFTQPGDAAGSLQRRPGSLRSRRHGARSKSPAWPRPALRSPPRRVHPDEAEDLGRIRAYRIEAGGKTYRLLRGEFHRHTEISADGGADGSLEDMWRYALDAAGLDWIGNGDHDNGGGKEYTWWLIQKTTDLYSQPPGFIPMFTYERSVAYPHGHRNVMFDHRGVRTLPRLVGRRRTWSMTIR